MNLRTLQDFFFYLIQFQDILKPAYNSIDLAEVELLDDNSEPRQFDQGLLEVNNRFKLFFFLQISKIGQ